MLSIGEFARLAGVSVRMLRHYDGIGLLRPERVDPATGYRSYGPSQLDRANRLVALKDLGFTLEEVGLMLAGSGSERVALLLRERRAQLQSQLSDDTRRLRLVEARLRSIEKENPVHTFTEASLPELRVAQLSATITEMAEIENEIGPMFDRVGAALTAAGIATVGPGVATYTDSPEGLIAAAAEQIGDAPVPSPLQEARVAAVPRALVTRYDAVDLAGIQQAWQALVTEVDARGLRPSGPSRELYIETPFDRDGARWVVDLQQPVA